MPAVTLLTLIFLTLILYAVPVSKFFKTTNLRFSELLVTLVIAAASVLWFELYKWIVRRKA
jgi:Ca2+-transporting ATPase